MNEFHDFVPKSQITNYKKWAFRFLIYIAVIHAASFYIVATKPLIHPFDYTLTRNGIYIAILGILLILFLLAGIILTLLSVSRREHKNYQYYSIIFMYPIYIIFRIVFYIYQPFQYTIDL